MNQLRPASGLDGYDGAAWENWTPELSLVRRTATLSSLWQTVPANAVGAANTRVPENDSAVVIFWTAGQSVDARLAGKRVLDRSQPWDFTVLPPGVDSVWKSEPEHADGAAHLHLSPTLIAQLRETCGEAELKLGTFRDERVKNLAASVFADLRLGGSSTLAWDSAGTLLGCWLLDMHDPEPRRGGLAPWQVQRTEDYLRAHLAKDVGLADLARLANLSTFHFARQFKATTGLPPAAFQRRLRVQKAQDLLLNTDLPIGDVAAAVGYDTLQAFSRMFGSEVGASPSAWRRERKA